MQFQQSTEDSEWELIEFLHSINISTISRPYRRVQKRELHPIEQTIRYFQIQSCRTLPVRERPAPSRWTGTKVVKLEEKYPDLDALLDPSLFENCKDKYHVALKRRNLGRKYEFPKRISPRGLKTWRPVKITPDMIYYVPAPRSVKSQDSDVETDMDTIEEKSQDSEMGTGSETSTAAGTPA